MEMIQNTVQEVMRAPNFWPITLTVSVLTTITLTWGLLTRISTKFDRALEDKLRPLVDKIEMQGNTLGKEALRLERHFDESMKEIEDRTKNDLTNALSGLRQEIKVIAERQHDIALKTNTNSTTVAQHKQDYYEFKQESKMDRQQLRRDSDSQKRQLDAIEAASEKSQEKIIEAINGAKDRLSDAQGNLSTRLTRVEEALKFWANVRVDEERSGNK